MNVAILEQINTLSAKLDSLMSAGEPADNFGLDEIFAELDKLKKDHPDEVAEFFKNNELTPFIGLGLDELKFLTLKPEYEVIYQKTFDNNAIDNLYPDGPLVYANYTNGDLSQLGWVLAGSVIDVTDKIHCLNMNMPRCINEWSDRPNVTVMGIVAITKSELLLINALVHQALTPAAANHLAFRTKFDTPFQRLLHFIPITHKEHFPSVNRESFSLAEHWSVENMTVYNAPILPTSIHGTLTGVYWDSDCRHYVRPTFIFETDEGPVNIIDYNLYYWMLEGLGVGAVACLEKSFNDYHISHVVERVEKRNLYIPKFCPTCHHKLLFEGGNREHLYNRCFEPHRLNDTIALNMLLRDVFLFDSINIKDTQHVNDLEGFLTNINTDKVYALPEVIYGLGIPELDRATAQIVTDNIKSVNDLIPLLMDSKRLIALGLHWGKVFDIVKQVQVIGAEFNSFLNYLKIDYSLPGKPIHTVGVIGTFRISRNALDDYFNYHDIALVDHSIEDCDVILIGYGVVEEFHKHLRKSGKQLVYVDNEFNFSQLIERVLSVC